MWFEEVVRHAVAYGEATAVSDERRSLSYGELATRTQRMAGGLRREGLQVGDRVGILAGNCVEVIEAMVALSLAGAVVVPLNHRLTPPEIAGLVSNLNLRAVLGEEALLSPIKAALPADGARPLDGPEWQAIAAGDPLPLTPRDPDAPAFGLLTSGTTSSPKCALISARGVRASALSWLASVRPSSEDIYLSCTPLFHSTVMIAIAYLGIGAHLALVRGFSPQRAIETIARLGVTQMYMVPSMLALTLRARGLEGQDCSSLLDIFHGGEPIDPGLREEAAAVFGARLRDCFGQAQGGGPIAVTDGSSAEQGSVGRPLHGVELSVGDAPCRPAAASESAEVWIRGDAVMSGYVGRPEDTAAAFSEGWLRTGDLGYLDRRGALRLVGRASDTIIRGGQNIYPAEIEELILGVEGIEDAAVFGVTDSSWGEVPVAAVVVADGREAGTPELALWCRERLAPYKRPVAFMIRGTLPRNATGKVRKSLLRDSFEEARGRDVMGAT